MPLTPWLLGLVLGAFAGGLFLEAGTLVVVLVVPALLWAARERGRPTGLGGLVTGLGLAWGVLIGWSDARCSADPSCHIPDDHTPWYVLAAVLVAIGLAITLLAVRRLRSGPGPSPSA